jgi:hypothetical protein
MPMSESRGRADLAARGVAPDGEIRHGRPYVWWEASETDRLELGDRVAGAYAMETVCRADPGYRGLVGHALLDFRRTIASGPGYVMVRKPLPGFPPILAQLRPDQPVKGFPDRHWHPPKKYTHAGDKFYDHVNSEKPNKVSEHEKQESGDSSWEALYNAAVEGHIHTPAKKYTFPIGKGQAARLEVHPAAIEMLKRGDVRRTFLCLEGLINSDALLERGEMAVSVPSVTMWPGALREMEALIGLLDKGHSSRTVYVLTDSDYQTNTTVMFNGLLCTEALQQRGANAVLAAPPGDPGGKDGIGDFLQGGGSVADLVTISVDLPQGFERWQEYNTDGQPRHRKNRERILRWLVLHSTAHGRQVAAPTEAIARYADCSPRTVLNIMAELSSGRNAVIQLLNPTVRKMGKGKPYVKPARYWIVDRGLAADYRYGRVGGGTRV